MAGKQKESDSRDRSVRTKKAIDTISIIICIFATALVINGLFWIVGQNVKIDNAEDALSGLKTAAYSAEGAEEQSNKHDIALEDRKNMKLTGVENVEDFTEQKIVVQTELGLLTITGRSLHIGGFDTKTGDMQVKGTIDSLVYSDKKKDKDIWKKLQ